MAYKKEQLRILAGSLNLLPPGEKIPAEDALELTNWRVDQAGQLKSRRGMRQQGADLAGGILHSLFLRSPAWRYAGVGARLYRSLGPDNYQQIHDGFEDGQPLGLASQHGFTWVMNQSHQGKDDGSGNLTAWLPAPPSSAPAVAAGATETKVLATFDFGEQWTVVQPDGNESGIFDLLVSAAGVVDVSGFSVFGIGTEFTASMVGMRLRLAGDATSYGIVTVASATSLTLDAPAPAVLASAYSIFEEISVADHDSVQKVDGTDSLHIACAPPGTWQAERATTGDFGIDGTQRDDDIFRIWMFNTDPAAIESISLAVDVNTGLFDLDYYVASIPVSQLSEVRWSWSRLEARRRLDAAGILHGNPTYLDTLRQLEAATDPLQRAALEQALAQIRFDALGSAAAFVRVGATADKDWSTARALRVTVKVREACDVHFDTWDVSGGLSGSLEGEFRWYITFDTDAGHESNPSPASAALTLAKQPATLSNIPVSPDPQVTRRHIYREGGLVGAVLRVGTIPDNITTTFPDLATEEDAQNRNTPMPEDHDAPPPARGLVRARGRLIAYSSAAHPGRYWWTNTAQPWFFPGSADEDEGNWQDAGEEEEEILHISVHGRVSWIYKHRSIWRLPGDPETADPEPTNAKGGTLGPKAVASEGALDYFARDDGVYVFNGDSERKLSHKVDPIFKGEYAVLTEDAAGVAGITIPPMADDTRRNCVVEAMNGRLYFSYPEAGHIIPSVTLICDLETERWSQHRIDQTLVGEGGFSALYYEGHGRALLGGVTVLPAGGPGKVFDLADGIPTDGGHPVRVVWMSAYQDMGRPDNPKACADLVIDYRTGDNHGTSSLVIKAFYDHGRVEEALATLNSAARERRVLPLAQGDAAANIAIRVEGNVTTECAIYAAYVHYYVEARKGRSFDSGVFGGERAQQIDRMEFEVTAAAAGTLTWAWHGDLPGGEIEERQTGEVAIAAARQVVRVTLPALHEGRKLRLLVDADVDVQVHGVRYSAVEIAEYVDGGAGEIWESKEIAYG